MVCGARGLQISEIARVTSNHAFDGHRLCKPFAHTGIPNAGAVKLYANERSLVHRRDASIIHTAHILGLVNTYQHRCLPRCLLDGLYIYDTINYGLREYRSRALCVIKDPHVHFTIRFAWVSLMLVIAIFFEKPHME